MIRSGLICLLAVFFVSTNGSAQSCTGSPVAVQILGSGGPYINRERASASYLLWVGDQAKILVDAGGGAFVRFGQSEAKQSDLAMVAISHLHPDHTSDLPALLWLSQSRRHEPLPIVGPSGNDVAPSFSTFLNRLFDQKNGAFQVLGGTLGAPPGPIDNGVRLDVSMVDVTKDEPSTVFDRDGLKVTALGIPHPPLPTLAYRAETRGVTVVFSSDQNGTNPKFVEFAKGANVLIMHLGIGVQRVGATEFPAAKFFASPAVEDDSPRTPPCGG
jgi:ribonuclease BN (tRNA processing enzyme)